MTKHTIICGDSRSMDGVADQSVHLVVTSPPYWQLKDYGTALQIGFHNTYQDYINHLNLVWRECHRVLENGCRLCINIGDQFARAAYYGRYKVIPIRTEIIKFCETMGFDYMGAIIWQKVITSNPSGGASIMGSFPTPRNGIVALDYEFILLFKKLGKPSAPSAKQKTESKMSTQEWRQYFSGHWNFAGEKQGKHAAVFPEELPKRLIKMFAFVGETVLDPFMGSGTTALAAKNLGRNSIGYEINPDFIPLIEKKIYANQVFADDISTHKQKPITQDFDKIIDSLPYKFVDHHALDKKIDPRKLNFGSRIDEKPQKKETLLRIKNILSGDKLVLSNDLKIRLLGIKIRPEQQQDACDFIAEKTRAQSVYLRFDEHKYDAQNNLLCYLYLKNKTFINARLIKAGCAQVDENTPFRHLEKFKSLEKAHGKRMDT